jgi:hypothetical protein
MPRERTGRPSRYVTRGPDGNARWETGIDPVLVARLRDAAYVPSRDEATQIPPEHRLEYRYEFGDSEILCREFVGALADKLRGEAGAILEVGAGSGRLAHFLSLALGREIVAIDNGRSAIPACVPVEAMDVADAYRTYRPEILLVSWPPEDMAWEAVPDSVRAMLLIGDPAECRWVVPPGFAAETLEEAARCQVSVSPGSTVLWIKKPSVTQGEFGRARVFADPWVGGNALPR